MAPAPGLRTLLQRRESSLQSSLDDARAQFAHSGDKGTDVERSVRQFLRLHLPRRYDVGEGEVIDTLGARTGQVDVVITDEDHPFSYPEDSGPGLYMVEGVVAAAEVKSVLTTSELEDIVEKADEFKVLQKYYSAGDRTLSTRPPPEDRYFVRPPYFGLALDNNVATKTIADRLAAHDRSRGDGPIGLDALFVLGQGIAINFGDGMDAYGAKTPTGIGVTGWVWADSDVVLADLLWWLAANTRRTVRSRSPIMAYLDDSMTGRDYYAPPPVPEGS